MQASQRYIFGFWKKLDQFSSPIYTVTAQPGGANKSDRAASHKGMEAEVSKGERKCCKADISKHCIS